MTQRTRQVTWDDPMTVERSAARRTGLSFLTMIVDGELASPVTIHVVATTRQRARAQPDDSQVRGTARLLAILINTSLAFLRRERRAPATT